MGMADWRALVAPPLDYLDFVNTLLTGRTIFNGGSEYGFYQ